MAPDGPRSSDPPSDVPPPRRGLDRLRSALPPARLLWLFLAAIGGYGAYVLGGLGIPSLIALPLVASVTDLAFQRVRFPQLRFPDAAIATGMFVVLVFPLVVPIPLAGTCVLAAVALRHVLRWHGRPWWNPAMSGILLGAVVFGFSPAWWVGIGPLGEYLLGAFGIALILRTPSSWRLPAVFLLTFGFLSVVQHVLVGATTDPTILLLGVVDPATLFFALFMVPEPRTAPGTPTGRVVYAGSIGIAAAFLPIAFPTIGILLALAVGNALSPFLRLGSTAAAPSPVRTAASRSRRSAVRPARWPVAYRVSAAFLVLLVIGSVAASTPVARTPLVIVSSPAGGGGGGGSGGCSSDNPAISPSALQNLHRMLGPSVVLSYDPSNGVVVFYDPVNHLTVTETDLYEDYGFAEFNGDDYAVSGCTA